MRHFATIAAFMIAGVFTSFAVAQGPANDYFLTDGVRLFKLQGDGLIRQRAHNRNEFALAVRGDIRTIHYRPGSDGSSYDRDLNYLGTDYTNTSPGMILDATTDGLYIYAIDFGTAEVIRFDMDWTNPTTLFDLGDYGDYLGITYDPYLYGPGYLWVSQWNGSMVQKYDMDGNLLSEFDVGYDHITCLGFDHSEFMLWMGSADNPNQYDGYHRDGRWSGQCYGPRHALGGEFDIGAVAAIESMRARVGTIRSGGAEDLDDPDNSFLVVKARRQTSSAHKSIIELKVRADSASDTRIHIVIESSITSRDSGKESIELWNWSAGSWETQLWTPISSELRRMTTWTTAADYIRSNGIIKVRIMHKVDNPSGRRLFNSKFDVIQVRTLK